MKIGFIGLGVMGRSMARNILQKSGAVMVWNRTASKADDLVKEGAVVAGSPAEVARACEFVCVCVADTPDVEAVLGGDAGVLAGIGAGKTVIDFSTISDKATEAFAARVSAKGAAWLDAPVSGGDVGARNGTLSIMVGGDADVFQKAMPVFEMVGKKIVHMGRTGNGQRTKMANQIAVAGSIAAMGEALAFAQQTGMDPEKVHDVISSGAAGSWSLSNYGPRVLRGDFAPGFAAWLQSKDLRLVLEAIEKLEPEFETTRRMAAIYEQMVAEGAGGEGNHAAVKWLGWGGTK